MAGLCATEEGAGSANLSPEGLFHLGIGAPPHFTRYPKAIPRGAGRHDMKQGS